MYLLPLQEHNVGSGRHNSGPSTLSIADHIIYVGNVIEYSHVDIGSDFDEMFETLPDLDDTSGFRALVERMVKPNVADEKIKLTVGLDVIRVIEEVEKVNRAARYVKE
jgi:microsomal dipeptidase-like Zn-dependent dipeptidase